MSETLNTPEENRLILNAELSTLDLDENTRQQLLSADDVVVGAIAKSKNLVNCFLVLNKAGLIKVSADQSKYQFVADYYRARARKAEAARAAARRAEIQGVLDKSLN